MRVLCLGLLLVNAVFFGWAEWIDAPEAAQLSSPPPPQALPLLALNSSPAPAPVDPGPPVRCRRLGPFATQEAARAAAERLRSLGLQPTMRTSGAAAPSWLELQVRAGEPLPALSRLDLGGEAGADGRARVAPPIGFRDCAGTAAGD